MIDISTFPTIELLDLTSEFMNYADRCTSQKSRDFWNDRLVEIDAELGSRQPVGEFRMLVDEAGQSVGFEQVIDDRESEWVWAEINRGQDHLEQLIRSF